MYCKANACLLGLIFVLVTVGDLLFCNVHFSPLYARHQAARYPANFTISQQCSWNKNNTNFRFQDYKTGELVLLSKLLAIIYKRHSIIPILREGSFLHAFRQLSADKDMDVILIVPGVMTMWEAFSKIQDVIKSNEIFTNVTFETTNILLSGIFFHKSDSVRFSLDGKKMVDVIVIHESFINDPDLQAPCLKQMHCPPLFKYQSNYIDLNTEHITTKNLFESLCKCNYMDSTLFCFDLHGAKYLEIRYGENYMKRVPGDQGYELIYERPRKTWRSILAAFPSLRKLKRKFEGHAREDNELAYNASALTSAATTTTEEKGSGNY